MNSKLTCHKAYTSCASKNINPISTTQQSNVFLKLLEQLFQALMTSDELQIREVYKKEGNTYFSAYDPITGQSIQNASEDELRSWIEQRFYA